MFRLPDLNLYPYSYDTHINHKLQKYRIARSLLKKVSTFFISLITLLTLKSENPLCRDVDLFAASES